MHSTTKVVPEEAHKDENSLEVKLGLVMQAKRDRKYPPLSEGDKVKVYTKKGIHAKETVSVWSDATYAVGDIVWDDGTERYGLVPRPVGLKQWYFRHELKKMA